MKKWILSFYIVVVIIALSLCLVACSGFLGKDENPSDDGSSILDDNTHSHNLIHYDSKEPSC